MPCHVSTITYRTDYKPYLGVRLVHEVIGLAHHLRQVVQTPPDLVGLGLGRDLGLGLWFGLAQHLGQVGSRKHN